MKKMRVSANPSMRRSWTVASWLFMALSSSQVYAAEGLLSLYDLAAQRDAQLQQAQAQFAADQELLNQAKSVLLPTISAQASYQQNDYSIPVPIAAKESQQQKLQLNQPLFDAASFARYEQAKSLVQQAETVYLLSQQQLMLRLSQSYLDVLKGQQLLSFAQAQLASTEKQRDQIDAGVKVGLTNPIDLLEVQARYDMALADVSQATNLLAISQENLARLIGQPVPVLKSLALDTRLPSLMESPEQLSQTGAQGNLNLRLNQRKVQASEQQVNATRAAHYPTVSLQASMSNLDSRTQFFNSPYQTNSIGVVLNVPLYAGGMVTSQVRQAEQQRLAAQAGLRYADEQAKLDVLSLAKTVQMAQSRLQALRQAVTSNEAFLQAAEEGNRVGLKSLVDVLNARTLLYKAKQDLANALFDDVQNRLSLRAAQGALVRDDLASIERYLRD
ncbi:MAG: TolC family outer membrane protein [Gammaproteobacteria bacterium]|nr:TolC family outer membrane protein [Gammaproteobacteria bacterium]HQT01933.1 TolC family outer membrane protein [Thiotrichales bacterium]HQT04231.1 TolC family outer membrane protein [Thiotrichales bacterium]